MAVGSSYQESRLQVISRDGNHVLHLYVPIEENKKPHCDLGHTNTPKEILNALNAQGDHSIISTKLFSTTKAKTENRTLDLWLDAFNATFSEEQLKKVELIQRT